MTKTYNATATIARFVAEVTYSALPAESVATAKTALVDSLGVAIAGSTEASSRIAAQAARAEAGRKEASVIGQGFRTSASQAAWVNGTAAHALDYDLTFSAGRQPTAVMPAVLALAEALGADGRRLLEAYVVGFEVTAKLARSVSGAQQRGWHATGTLGVMGAAAACSKLLGLDAVQVEMALGIAASMASGLECNFGTMTKPLHAGHAARNGVLAARLAAAGYTANAEAMEAEGGFYDVYYGVTPAEHGPLEELGQSYELSDKGIRFKLYPCAALAHAAIDAMLQLREAHRLAPAKVDAIQVDVPQRTLERLGFGIPRTGLEGKFSMPYLIARALVHGAVGLDAFTEAAVLAPDVLTVADKVLMRLDPDMGGGSLDRPARVTVRLVDGQSVSLHVDVPKGGPEAPMTADELRAKFLACARQAIDEDSTERILEHVERLETLDDLQPLARLLAGTREDGRE